jgi:hypothetical protein
VIVQSALVRSNEKVPQSAAGSGHHLARDVPQLIFTFPLQATDSIEANGELLATLIRNG